MAEGGPELSFGDGTGTDLLSGIVNYIQEGGSVTNVFTASFVGVFISPFIAIADVIDGIGTFFSTPFTEGGLAIGQLINALFTAPGSLLETGAQVSEDALTTFLGPTIAGLLGLPVAVGVTVLSLWIIVQYLEEPETGDSLPGVPVDVPDPLGLNLGVEEESEDEDEDNIG